MKIAKLTDLCAAASLFLVSSAGAMDGTAKLIDGNGKNAGSVELLETPSGVTKITIFATGLPIGWHGFHIHETGDCTAEEGFKSACGHLAGDRKHGIMDEGGPHPGDLPNQMVQENGVLAAEVFSTRLNMTNRGAAAVFDQDRSAVMIHSGPDDYTSQTSGAAGSRQDRVRGYREEVASIIRLSAQETCGIERSVGAGKIPIGCESVDW